MPLSPGSHLGPYEVLALIGAGGMGEVYRARDPRLNREVAIKVLPADRLSDETRRRRFVQEAQAASALNHPHIITIHEIESAGDHDFIVMEYVHGKSLDALIPRQGMRLGEALRIAIAVAGAVECAHRHNIVHRDLKPANVMVGTDGAVKVLDFGVAKLLTDDEADSQAPTRTLEEAITWRGQVMGTLAYMAPEQASGEAVDARADIFSFGAMLYEMATGQRAFSGKTPAETLSAVMHGQPTPPSTLIPSLPHDLERTILRCLRKDPAKRFQTMADVRVDLAEIKDESDSGGASPTPIPRPRLRWLAVAAASGLVGVAVAAWYFWHQRPHEAAPMHVVPLTAMTGHAMYPTFSPDGQQIAFAWQPEGQNTSSIYVKLIGLEDMRRLTSDPANDRSPSWSPDGRQIAFVRDSPQDAAIYVVSPLGGGERRLSDLHVWGAALTWSPDGRYLAAAGTARSSDVPSDVGIYLIPLNHGDPRLITPPHLQCDSPALSPDGHGLAYVEHQAGNALDVVTLDSTFTATGPPRRLVPHVSEWLWGMTWSRDGRQVIYSAQEAGMASLWRVQTDGGTPPERIEIAGTDASSPAVAPSADRLAFSRDLGAHVPYRFEAEQPSRPLLTSVSASALAFSPDGRRVTYCATSGDAMEIWTARADGSTPLQLTRGPGRWQCSPRWSPDARQIAFDSQGSDYQWHIWTIAADGGGAPRQVTSDRGNVPTWSRDGQWIYYSGKNLDLWRIQLADGRKQQLTHEGYAVLASESADGKTLVYQERSALLTMPLAGGPSHQLVPCTLGWAVSTAPPAIFYLTCSPQSGWGSSDPALHVLNPSTGADRLLGTLERYAPSSYSGLAVSPDGKVIVYDRLQREGHDLMLIENFR